MGETVALHAFADRGVESEVLTQHFDVVYRLGLDPRDTNDSIPIEADVAEFVEDPTKFGFDEDVTFDFILAHPPCTKWANMTSISGDPDDHENLIPLARELVEKYADEWVIENKPNAPLEDPVVLDGKMFGLEIVYERGFETSFDVEEPPREQERETEVSPYFYSDRSHEWWAAEKGYSAHTYGKQHLAKNAVPADYIRWLIRQYYKQTKDTATARSNHSDPDPIEVR
jgi:hypothetical protein